MKAPSYLSSAHLSRRNLIGATAALAAAAAAGRLTWVGAQEAAPTPQPGTRPDGSQLWRVQVAGGNMDDGIELMGFFPNALTINAGDAIFFDFSAGMPEVPHTVSFLAGGPIPDLVVPEVASGTPVADGSTPRLMFNPEVAFPKGDTTVDGSGPVSSGMNILRPAGSSYILEFPAPGKFAYVDLVFPMVATGEVTVLDQGAALPYTQEQYDQATSDLQAPQLATGQQEIAEYASPMPESLSDGSSRWTVTSGVTNGNVEIAAFVPATLTIKAGDTVRWSLEKSTLEVHTATFAGNGAAPELLVIEPQPDGNPLLILNPVLVAPAGEEVYPGDELANTGFISTRFPFPPTADLTFASAGQYPYYCAIHGTPTSGMRGMIIVE